MSVSISPANPPAPSSGSNPGSAAQVAPRSPSAASLGRPPLATQGPRGRGTDRSIGPARRHLYQSLIFAVLCLILSTPAGAQPGGEATLYSLEARVAQAHTVFRGTITNAFESNQHYTFDLRVDEILKGTLPEPSLRYNLSHVNWKELLICAEGRVSFLWFVNSSLNELGSNFFAGQGYLSLGPTRPGRPSDAFGIYRFEPVRDRELNSLTNVVTIMSRAWACAGAKTTTNFHKILLPQLSTSDHYFFKSYLLVPVDAALENTSKRLLKSPGSFLSKTNSADLIGQWSCDLRAQGVAGLQYFDSRPNRKLLKRLLHDPGYYLERDWSPEFRDLNRTNKVYPVRKEAFEVLGAWGVPVQKPVMREPMIPAAHQP